MITILLSTYNGEKYLIEQLDSLLSQEGVSINILVRDDGSTDGTISILNKYQDKGYLTWYTGENLGPARSFIDLLSNAPESEYYAFCDQDDVWLPEKLRVAVEKIRRENYPSLYCSDTLMVDSSLNVIRPGGLHADGTFAESLISNPVTGCTMVFNNTLKKIALQYLPETIDMHDWWLYRICMAVGGIFYFDSTPHIKYRQHGDNVIGGQSDRRHTIKRHLNYFLHPSEGIRYTMAKELYKGFYSLMSGNNKTTINMFVSYKDGISNTLRLVNSPDITISNQKVFRTFKRAVLLRKF